MLLKIHPVHPEINKISQVIASLQAGGVLVYPTDTVYGLGCDIFNKKAVAKIYQLKKRDPKKPCSILCSDIKQIAEYAVITDWAFQIIKKTLPGPYTFILKAKNKTPQNILAKNKTVGVRIPNNQICLQLVEALGNPIITTSLNISGAQILTNPNQLSLEMKNKIDIIIDAGDLPQEASTVIDLSGDTPQVIRQGAGSITELNI